MADFSSFSLREIGGRDRLEEFALHETVETASGKQLEVILVCGGVGGGQAGERAARLAGRSIIDSLEIAEGEAVPNMLVRAVEEANRVVYSEMRGTGSSTVAVVAVDLNDGEYGRAFIASVGDSRIYLVRRREMVRLNIDHTIGNENIYAELMSANDAARLENADYPTRIVGINPEVQVDIGFYVERGNPFVNARRAFEIGKRGMLLQEGDTLIAATRSLFIPPPNYDRAALEDENFVDFAMDNDAQHAVRGLLDIATRRTINGNATLAMTFVPSRLRRPVRVGARLGRRAQIIVALTSVAAIGALTFGALSLIRTEQQSRIIRQTRQAFEEVVARASWTATFTPTPTMTPTMTPTPTPTVRPTAVSENQVAIQYFSPRVEMPEQPIFLTRRVSSESRSYLIITGPNSDNLPNEFQPASLYMQRNNSVEISQVTNGPGAELMSVLTYPETDIFIKTGNFFNGGTIVNVQSYENVSLFARAACISSQQIPPDPNDPEDTEKIAFTCYGNQPNSSCSYTLANSQPSQFNMGQRILLDLDRNEFIIAEDPYYEEIKRYRDTVFELTQGEEGVSCLRDYLDIDGDGVLYPFDECETEPGSSETAGCPDIDGDGIRDSEDECPKEPGPIDNQGCPLATATPFNLDPDGDGLLPPEDQCPTEFGLPENNGCPVEAIEDDPAAYGDV